MKLTIVMVLAIVAIFGGAITLDRAQCRGNVQEMGREYRYNPIQGCRVGLKDGTFIYWKMYREINDGQ